MSPDTLLHVISRFIHISSVVILIGGLFYARQVLTPVLSALPEDLRSEAASETQRRFRNPLFALLALIVGSGLYNFLTGPHHGKEYQIWFGVKMLLVAHLAATAILWGISSHGDVATAGKPGRRLLSIAISGLLVIAISAYLRSLALRGL